jgi:hypothetical protein
MRCSPHVSRFAATSAAWFSAAAAAATFAAGCTDFATPAELTKPTILLVVAEPPIVAPGGTTELSVVIAGPDGPMSPTEARWRLTETLPGVPPFGSVEPGEPGRATYTAPDPVPALPEGVPPLASVELTIDADATSLVAIKALPVADLPSGNPSISALAIGEQVVGDEVTLEAGEIYPLDVGTVPAAGESATYAWYSTVGEIAYYQSNPCELIAAEEPTQGWLFVVVRDGRGGGAWRGVHVTVE